MHVIKKWGNVTRVDQHKLSHESGNNLAGHVWVKRSGYAGRVIGMHAEQGVVSTDETAA